MQQLQDDLDRVVEHSQQKENNEVADDTQQKQKQLEDLSVPYEVATNQHHSDLGVDYDLASKQHQQHGDIAVDSDVLPLPKHPPMI
jgi:hypothetical protein